MKHELDVQEQYICDECGYTSPVSNERCPDCGSVMTSLSEESKKKGSKNDDDEFSEDDDIESGNTSSLEDLQTKEQEESDEDYKNDTYGEG